MVRPGRGHVERNRLAGSVATPLLLAAAAAAAAAAARAVLDPTLPLAAPPTATAAGALEANKTERSAVTCLSSSHAGARPSTANGGDGSANDAKDTSQIVTSMPSLRRWMSVRWGGLGLGLG